VNSAIILISMMLSGLHLCPDNMSNAIYFCIDKFEAPNVYGEQPMVMQSALDGELWCGIRGKRLCTEDEWEFACKISNQNRCNNDKTWIPWSFSTRNPWPEVKRLWQGSRAGEYASCRTSTGVHDLIGNVEEWAVSRKGRDWPFTLKGGFWAKKNSCIASNDAHEPTFRFYGTGTRCCRSLKIGKLYDW
jgi:sulfatase modifying factor 1